MTLRDTLAAAFGRPRERHLAVRSPEPTAEPGPEFAGSVDPATIQVMAHTLIAGLFGTGLRVQNLAARAPDELRPELEEIAEQIDTMISEVRSFAFTHRR
jgi:hypothetical protein